MTNIPPGLGPSGMGHTEGQKGIKDKGQKEFKLEKEHDKEIDSKKERQKEVSREDDKEDSQVIGLIKEGKVDPMSIMSGQTTTIEKAEPIQGITKSMEIDAINKLILKTVESLQVGEAGAIITIQENADVPTVFQGAKIELNLTEGRGLQVHFELAEGMSEADAYNIMSQNKLQLQQLATNLEARRIHLEKIEMGQLTIPIAEILGENEVEPLAPSPLHPDAHRQREQRGGREGGGEQGPRDRK